MIKKKAIASICKAHGNFTTKNTAKNIQWLGDSGAMYILERISPMPAESLAILLDCTEKDMEKLNFSETDTPDNLFADDHPGDVQIKKPPKRVYHWDKEFLVYEVDERVIIIDSEYLKPIVSDGQTTFFIRPYYEMFDDNICALCVKQGLFAQAVILETHFDTKAAEEIATDLSDTAAAIRMKYLNSPPFGYSGKSTDEEGENNNEQQSIL